MAATVLTGATGFVGQEILARLLAAPGDAPVVLPIRSSRGASAAQRGEALFERTIPDLDARDRLRRRIRVVEVDLADERSWKSDVFLDQLEGASCRVIHGAASVSFDMPLAQAREVNVQGTQRMLRLAEDLARRNLLDSFAYISTAFVAGERNGTAFEHELDVGQDFANSYERTKFEAESSVQQRAGSIPLSVFRPSIVAGDSRTGATNSFKVLYWPLKVVARGLVPCFPGRREASYDIVPVDFVADALLHILESEPASGRTFHLTSARTVTMQRLLEITAEVFGLRRIPPVVTPQLYHRLVEPLMRVVLWGKTRETMLGAGRVYFPYLVRSLCFDHANTASAVRSEGIALPDTEEYVRKILHFARETNFGQAGG
jgi:thioester reductase-like protein